MEKKPKAVPVPKISRAEKDKRFEERIAALEKLVQALIDKKAITIAETEEEKADRALKEQGGIKYGD